MSLYLSHLCHVFDLLLQRRTVQILIGRWVRRIHQRERRAKRLPRTHPNSFVKTGSGHKQKTEERETDREKDCVYCV